MTTLEDRLQANAHAVQMPIGAEDEFQGVIDLIEMQADIYDEDELGAKWDTVDVPADYLEEATKRRAELVEAVADVNDDIMDKYLEGEEISKDELKAAIRQATIDLKFFPVFAGSAFKNKGVQMLMDGVVDYLPSPLDVRPYNCLLYTSDAADE